MQTKQAEWNGDTLSCVEHYDWPEPHYAELSATKCDPLVSDCTYWVAVEGQCYGFNKTQNTCIANVEAMLREAGHKAMYVTFALRNRTPGTWKRWQDKWSKRTTNPHPFDASVRSY